MPMIVRSLLLLALTFVAAPTFASNPPINKVLVNEPGEELLQAKLHAALSALYAKHGSALGRHLREEIGDPWGEITLTLQDDRNSISCTADFGESIPPRTGGYETHYSCSFDLSGRDIFTQASTARTTVAGLLNEAVVDTLGARALQREVTLSDGNDPSRDGANYITCQNPSYAEPFSDYGCSVVLPGAVDRR